MPMHSNTITVTKNNSHDPKTMQIIIRPAESWMAINIGEIWSYRELLYFMTLREIKVRYKQTALGALWAILQPIFTMLVFSLFFGRLAKIPSDGIPYPVFAFAALVPWMFFANGLSQASNSLVGSSHLITKVYFPRLVIPISAVLSGLIDFGLSFSVLLLVMAWFGIYPGLTVLWLPALLLLALITALGVGLWLSALNVQYRDVRFTVPFLMQIWMFATPIVYPSSLLPEPWRSLYALNPMVGVVEGFRWVLLGAATRPGPMILISAAVSICILISGLLYFRRMESTFADIV